MWKSQKIIMQGLKNQSSLTYYILSLAPPKSRNLRLCNLHDFAIPYRTLCSTACSNQKKQINPHKEIYKEIKYNAPFSSQEKNLILKTIHEAKSAEKLSEFIAKPKAAVLYDHMNAHGEFEVIEELLSVKKFDDKILERLCKKVLKSYDKSEESQEHIETTSETKSVKHKISKYIKPRLTSDVYENIESIVAFKLSFYDISYTHFETKSQKVISWHSFDSFGSKASTEHPRLFETATEVASQLPCADLYLLEEQLPILQGKHQSNLRSHGIKVT